MDFFCNDRYIVDTLASPRPFQILLGNVLATFTILSNFSVREQLLATFRKTSTFFSNFWAILNR